MKVLNGKELIEAYIQRLRQLLEIHQKAVRVELEPRPTKENLRPDAFIRIDGPVNLDLVAEIKDQLRTRNEAVHAGLQAETYAEALGKQAILFAPWIGDHVAQELRKRRLFYLDLEGNAYLWDPPRLAIDIRGRRPEKDRAPKPGRLIQPAGLKAIHLILTRPEALHMPYRWIAEQAGVALGTVTGVVRALVHERMIERTGKRAYKLADRRKLVDHFVRGYTLALRPACMLGRYRHKEPKIDHAKAALVDRLTKARARWALTGGQAAFELTHYLRTDEITIFVDKAGLDALGKEPLVRDTLEGNVILLDHFAPAVEQPIRPHVATPLLVYAELLDQKEGRAIETAGMILDRYLLKEA